MRSDRLRLRDVRDTSAFRLTVGLGGVFAIGLLALIGLVYVLVAHELVERTDRILRTQAERLLAAPADQLPVRLRSEIERSNGFSHLALLSSGGERVAGDVAIHPAPPPGRTIETDSDVGPIRLMAVRTAQGETIIVARDISQIRYLRGRLLLILLSSGVTLLLGVAGAAVLLARKPLRRVRNLEVAARAIARGRFDTRLAVTGSGDELDQIAATLNRMTDEIGHVVAQVKGVTDAVAHDLRTPLAHVRQRLLELSGQPAAAAIAAQAIAELDLVLARFAALLRIAEIEAGARRAHFAPVDLAALAAEAVELYEPLAEESGTTLTLCAPAAAIIAGDRHLLLEALSNLLDNAIKFGASRVTIEVLAAPLGMSVTDDGPGIPASEREAALRRFHRGTNAEGIAGTGLGLSIVAAIAHLHALDLVLEDARPGLVVRVATPR